MSAGMVILLGKYTITAPFCTTPPEFENFNVYRLDAAAANWDGVKEIYETGYG